MDTNREPIELSTKWKQYCQIELEREWEQYYQNEQDKSEKYSAWFYPELDPDVEKSLKTFNLSTGSVLDIGAGLGTQAIALAQRGFQVTATEVSSTAVEKGKRKALDLGLNNLAWEQDNILQSHLAQQFDLVLDRGCFHLKKVYPKEDYVSSVHNLIKSQGYLFLKCLSYKEKKESRPERFTPEKIREIFRSNFTIISIEDSVMHSTLERAVQSLWCVMQKS